VIGLTVWFKKILDNTKFRNVNMFPSSGEGKETSTLLGPLGNLVIEVIDFLVV
jgi:hypothetical protein